MQRCTSLLNPPSNLILSSGITVAGSISLFGGVVTVDQAITASGAIKIKANGNNDVLLNAAIINNSTTATSLEIEAGRHIRVGSNAEIRANNAAMDTRLWADTDRSGDGIIYFESAGINTFGGSLNFGKEAQTLLTNANILVGGDVYFQRTGGQQSLITLGGAVNIYGETIVANTNGLTINSVGANSSGDVTLHGLLNSGNQYVAVSGSWTWEEARANATTVANSYLATITSRLENSIAGLAVNYQSSWLGGLRNELNNEWRWVTDPDYNATTNPLIFFYQGQATPTTSNTIGTGGTTAPGYFANWNRWTEGLVTGGSEPNNSGGNERGLQFTGSDGLWNDLPHTGSRLNVYVRETNLVASPVVINAGTGSVQVSGGVGTSKALASLNVTSSSTTVQGNGLITTGAQNYSSSLTVNNSASTVDVRLTAGGAGISTAGDLIVNGKNISVNASLDTRGGSSGVAPFHRTVCISRRVSRTSMISVSDF